MEWKYLLWQFLGILFLCLLTSINMYVKKDTRSATDVTQHHQASLYSEINLKWT